MRLEDEGHQDPTQDLIDTIVQERFEKEYIGALRGRPRHVLLEGKTVSRIDDVYFSNVNQECMNLVPVVNSSSMRRQML